MGEHRLGDKRLAYEESLRVPLVIAGGDVAARRVNAMVTNLDLAPTLLDLAGVPVPGTMQGHSLAALLRGGGAGVRDAFLYEYMSESAFPVIPDMFAIRTQGRKLVVYPGSPDEELYDLATDPSELQNLAFRPEWAPVHADLRRQLDLLLAQTGAPQP
jgi:arylsulfatase A-like enzyme